MKAMLIPATFCLLLASCGAPANNDGNASASNEDGNSEEYRLQYEQQLKEAVEQNTRVNRIIDLQEAYTDRAREFQAQQETLLKTEEARLERFDKLLDKWEKQAERYDSILDKWEEPPSTKEFSQ